MGKLFVQLPCTSATVQKSTSVVVNDEVDDTSSGLLLVPPAGDLPGVQCTVY